MTELTLGCRYTVLIVLAVYNWPTSTLNFKYNVVADRHSYSVQVTTGEVDCCLLDCWTTNEVCGSSCEGVETQGTPHEPCTHCPWKQTH